MRIEAKGDKGGASKPFKRIYRSYGKMDKGQDESCFKTIETQLASIVTTLKSKDAFELHYRSPRGDQEEFLSGGASVWISPYESKCSLSLLEICPQHYKQK